MERAGRGASPAQRVRLLCDGLDAVWRRAAVTLGEVTLQAVGRRVLLAVSETSPTVRGLSVGPRGLDFGPLLAGPHPDPERLESELKALLAELLRVLTAITSGVMEPMLLDALMNLKGRTDTAPPAVKGRRRK